ncbi:hypothetical protein PR048_029951 [Dryococelus australis]|uniref:Reverse transcriptase/retrotransposon-derived protein RNase H-like domain-containing protein n=1 Tax=Dryococelus australis TaxID=614101 RepID=A0ABQ9G7K4_9NEOP|nr:hypothetical protein PR048_029951 [Dryococelus australis]
MSVQGIISVKFLGHIVSKGIVQPDPGKTKAIRDIPDTTNVTELSNHYESCYKMKKWVWGDAQKEVMDTFKQDLTKQPTLALYSCDASIRIPADALSYGLGAQQEHHWKPIMYASQSLNETVTRVHIGNMCKILTDHKPTVTLVGSKPLAVLTASLQRLRIMYQGEDSTYQMFSLGAPIKKARDEGKEILNEDLYIHNVIATIKEAQEKEMECQKLKENILHQFAKEFGFSQRTSSPCFLQSNGESEKALDIAKHILSKSEDPNLDLSSRVSQRSLPIVKVGDSVDHQHRMLWMSPVCCRSTKIIHVPEEKRKDEIGDVTNTVNISETFNTAGSSKQCERRTEAGNPVEDNLLAEERVRMSSHTEQTAFLGFPARESDRNQVFKD